MINPNKELFKWGPIDGRPVFPDIWYAPIMRFAKRFVSWPYFFMRIHNEKIMFISEYQKLRDIGEKNFKQFILPDNEFKKNFKEWQNAIKDVLSNISKIEKKDLKHISDKELYTLFRVFVDIYSKMWVVGLLPELSNWGGEQMLKRELSQKIKDEKEFILAFEKFSAPENCSFYQEAEMELLRIKKFEKDKKEFEKRISEYQKKFFWLLNSYHHTQVLSTDYFKRELARISKKEANRRLKKLEKLHILVLKNKKELIKKYKLNFNVEKIAHRLAFCIWWQDNRKKHIFIANHCIDVFLKEISMRFNIDFDDLHYYRLEEILTFICKRIKIADEEMKKRKNYYMIEYLPEENNTRLSSGNGVEKFIKHHIKSDIDTNLRELRGLVVCIGKGLVQGIVKIVNTSKDIGKVKKGDILVAAMTAPDYIVAMKKASAIITDEGGMTSHAAIVSRELGIPCIVGTKIATKVLKDGDTVEVDADNGIVRIIR